MFDLFDQSHFTLYISNQQVDQKEIQSVIAPGVLQILLQSKVKIIFDLVWVL